MPGQSTGPAIPMPVWHNVKVQAAKDKKQQKKMLEKRSTKFETENKVLGHTVKSDVSKPRALLSVPVLKFKNKENSTDEDKLRQEIWKARTFVGKGYSSFLALQELQRLVRNDQTSDAAREHLMTLVRKHIMNLEKSLGVFKRFRRKNSTASGIGSLLEQGLYL